MLPLVECSKPACTGTQDPALDNCTQNDGYSRTLIYRSWNTSCPPYQPDFNKTKTYVWDYHGAWYWGSELVLRCLPGFILPAAYQNVIAVSLQFSNGRKCLQVLIFKQIEFTL
jgi:hypothetical protein